MRENNSEAASPVQQAIRTMRPAILGTALLSAAINILMLTGPLYMLQIYDRVLTSRSVPTLVAMSLLVGALYVFLGLFDYLRGIILSRLGFRFDCELMARAGRFALASGLNGRQTEVRPVQDLATIRQFATGSGPGALFDLPWVPFYLAIVFALHLWLGILVTIGTLVVLVLTLLNEVLTSKHGRQANALEALNAEMAQSNARNAGPIIAMGMTSNVTARWEQLRNSAMAAAQHASETSAWTTAGTKTVRMIIQSAILGLGAWLAILGEISPGSMIAASIIAGRALAPIDLALGNWRGFQSARQAYRRINDTLKEKKGTEPVNLPPPSGSLELLGVTRLGTGGASAKPILQGITLSLDPGDGLGVIGPSGSGKTTLARLLAGLGEADRGEIRLAGSTYSQWDRDRLGKHLGYLPQFVELLPGSVFDNIARFDPSIEESAVFEAAASAGVHEMILRLPDGYASYAGTSASILSGGQAQRIALARAILGNPALVILDEPNSNLDAEGDAALASAITRLREAGSIVVVMAHRPSAIAAVNKILMLQDGQQTAFGPKDEVLRKVTRIAPVKAG